MKYLKLPFQRETIAPMLALMFASAASLALILTHIVWTKDLHYGFLIWNLCLAWLPLVFAILARETYREEQRRTWRFYGLAGLWLLFFPNAPYIWTDVVHLWTRYYQHFWIDLMLILLCALTGSVLGFVSLYLMQSVVARMFGRVTSWLFVAGAAGLSSLGVYLGRFMRFNSWDVFLRPDKIYHGLDAWTDGRVPHLSSAAFLVLFTAFLFIAYVLLYALTRLPQPDQLNDSTGKPLRRV
jgi:uncharacterized membrane protein